MSYYAPDRWLGRSLCHISAVHLTASAANANTPRVTFCYDMHYGKR